MVQIRLHGRGGQGVVTAAELIAIAAFADGHQAQAFPSFGVERTGAPIQAFTRIDDNFIRTREQVKNPDILVILDSSLLETVDMTKDCDQDTLIVINTALDKNKLNLTYGPEKKKLPEKNIFAVDATKIALEVIGRNLANTTVLGALARAIDLISPEGIKKAIRQKFKEKGAEIITKNIKAVERAYKS